MDERENYTVFESHQIKEFFRSQNLRKVLFADPSQLGELQRNGLQFDLFINHESFAEMLIATVNSYLEVCGEMMVDDSTYFLCNRESRVQAFLGEGAEGYLGTTQVTRFGDYLLSDVRPIYQGKDEFREILGPHGESPNRIFIGKRICKV